MQIISSTFRRRSEGCVPFTSSITENSGDQSGGSRDQHTESCNVFVVIKEKNRPTDDTACEKESHCKRHQSPIKSKVIGSLTRFDIRFLRLFCHGNGSVGKPRENCLVTLARGGRRNRAAEYLRTLDCYLANGLRNGSCDLLPYQFTYRLHSRRVRVVFRRICSSLHLQLPKSPDPNILRNRGNNPLGLSQLLRQKPEERRPQGSEGQLPTCFLVHP
jgi:hypothetical protein